ncbi:MAG: carbamoyltransferase HypF [Phycisphaerae bacterium]
MAGKFGAGAILRIPSTTPVIGVGGELKNTVCVVKDGAATLSPAIGNLREGGDYRRFLGSLQKAVSEATSGHSSRAGVRLVLAHDLHPTYLSTVAARRSAAASDGIRTEAVQHHHAHIVACMVEHGVTEPVIGIACDGAGFGSDGAVWGGEVLHVTRAAFERSAHIGYFALPGGDAAAKETWRAALGVIHSTSGGALSPDQRAVFERVGREKVEAVQTMLERGLNAPKTSSLGRLFDAAAFLTGVCDFNAFEGQAAIALEEAAEGELEPAYPFEMVDSDGKRELVVRKMIVELCRDVRAGADRRVMASRFHATAAAMVSTAALAASGAYGVDCVALSGGCFLNRILVECVERLLIEGGVKRVLKHENLSSGDASLALGQAAVAAARLEERE